MYTIKKNAAIRLLRSHSFNGWKILLFALASILLMGRANAQPEFNYAGKHFFYSMSGTPLPPDPYYNPNKHHIGFSSKHLAHVTIRYNNTQYGNPPVVNLVVNPGEVVKFAPSNLQMSAMGEPLWCTVGNRSIEIESDSNIIVHVLNKAAISEDGTVLIPVDEQPKARRFKLIAYEWPWNTAFPTSLGGYFYMLVSTCDSNVIQITPAANIYTHPNNIPNNIAHAANVPFSITMNKGETYKVYSGYPLTNTEIEVLSSTANVPLCVYASYISGFIPEVVANPTIACCADQQLEQLLPVEWWDTLAPVSLLNWNNKARVRVITATSNTQVWFDNTPVGIINTNTMIDTVIDRSVIVHADHPVAIIEFMLSNFLVASPNRGDPDMHWKMSPRQGIKESYFHFFGPRYPYSLNPTDYHNAVTVISKASNINNILLDGNSIASYFQPFPANPSWMFAHVPIDSSDTTVTHHIISPEKILGHVSKAYTTGGFSYNLADLSADLLPTPLILTTDTVYKCRGASATLLSTINGPVRKWSTGSTAPSIIVADSGTYWVQGREKRGCDSQLVEQHFYVINTYNTVQEGFAIDSLIKCSNSDITLQASPAFGWHWNTGDTTVMIITKDTGLYFVHEYFAADTCKTTYKLHEFYVQNSFFPFNLRKDTTICKRDTIWLESGHLGTVWSTGDTGTAIRVYKEGMYWASVTDTCGIGHSDTIRISHRICPERFCNSIAFPDAFSPNGDGINDVFRTIRKGDLTRYYLAIFNRWGQEVFHTYDIEGGWDGIYNGEPAEPATYMYLCRYSCPGTGTLILKGDVTLVR